MDHILDVALDLHQKALASSRDLRQHRAVLTYTAGDVYLELHVVTMHQPLMPERLIGRSESMSQQLKTPRSRD
jgi:hypothetical protein